MCISICVCMCIRKSGDWKSSGYIYIVLLTSSTTPNILEPLCCRPTGLFRVSSRRFGTGMIEVHVAYITDITDIHVVMLNNVW